MLQFKSVTKQDGPKLRRYYKGCDYGLCEYSVGTKLMWRNTLHPTWTETAGCLVVRNNIDGQVVFDYPVPGPEGDEDQALTEIESYCLEQGIPPVISVVPECKAARLLSRYPYVRVSDVRTWRDYEAEFPKGNNAKARDELELAKKMLRMVDKNWFVAGGMFDGEKLIALSLAERCGDTLIIHIEKALYSYTGVYPTLVQAFADAFGGDCQWLNREDDAADKGLRTSKRQYGPAKLAPKYRFEPQNELLSHVSAIPELKTARLTLSALTEADIPAYNALVLDGDRNRWWGYDDVAGLGGPVEERSFFEVARRDFENRLAANFAIRLDGKLIGEAVLYRFDCRGGAELGCRIDKAYAGNGYGTEAFAAVAIWGLYKVHLTRVVAKCFRENQASYHMLSSCMRKNGEDETFFYFEKLV